MNLTDFTRRPPTAEPWVEGEKIPWNEPTFSRRMLREHLSQSHDAASRRTSKIKKQVEWIHTFILASKPSRILDLGCGPGLYSARLSALGHELVGIDFSPASVEYAVEHSPSECEFHLGDVRVTPFGSGYDLVMFIFGELNVFKRADAKSILVKACAALKPGGRLLLEVSTYDSIDQKGNMPPTWYSSEGGLFSDDPYLCLMESFWSEEERIATERYHVIAAASGEWTRFTSSTCAYENEEYEALVRDAGFTAIRFYPSLIGKPDPSQDELQVILAEK